MNGATPRFWAGPLRYWRWAARERPGQFWAVVIGSLGPLTLATVPPIRRAIGDPDAAPIPLTYPGMFPFFLSLCVFWLDLGFGGGRERRGDVGLVVGFAVWVGLGWGWFGFVCLEMQC